MIRFRVLLSAGGAARSSRVGCLSAVLSLRARVRRVAGEEHWVATVTGKK